MHIFLGPSWDIQSEIHKFYFAHGFHRYFRVHFHNAHDIQEMITSCWPGDLNIVTTWYFLSMHRQRLFNGHFPL